MQFKNLQIILVFVTYVSFVLSSPIEVKDKTASSIQNLKATEEMQSITDKIKVTEFRGDDGVDALLEVGGFDNDSDMYRFILDRMGYNITNIFINRKGMACSAFHSPNEKGNGYYFGRNFDWVNDCNKLIMVNHPDNGYSSISTVNTDFISWVNENYPLEQLMEIAVTQPELIKPLPDELVRLVSLYIPVDGINEKGLSISVNMVPGEFFNQNKEGLRHLTTGSANRVLLNKAANVDEALDILKNSNLHSTLDINIHFLISDSTEKSVTVEYINNKMIVSETKIITNFYIADEIKEYSIDEDGRYKTIEDKMKQFPNMSINNVRDTLNAVNQEEYTQWSVIYDQLNLEATYFFNINYEKGYHIKLFDDESDDETIVVSDLETSIVFDDSDSDDESNF
ncbi:hypothetical protein PIROE2DRAFT_67334 [Piromyces sp. E2]|nr:hypothetical protein PIROE2DRAFT_67334 [Piromyces sp. E2]|eukprot:OUM64220.1 hypothetical protein PIROE2DRAFT_67334 [Piromyces sp. E2]